jgi:uncharacterized NAD(P)/FAD-binding protein YdhS
MPGTTIAVVGAGFSGTMLSLWLQASAPAGTRICLIERSGAFAVGHAYATTNRRHLLNVPAGRMSAFPDLPGDFVQWLGRHPEARLGGVVPGEAAFVPRALYGAYLQDLLDAGLREARSSRLELWQDTVVEVEDRRGGVRLGLASGTMLDADIAVLATGNAPPSLVHRDVGALRAAGLWRGSPLASVAFAGLESDVPVLLLGSGLTMVDAVISLLDAGHTGRIHAVSRHGLLPRRHSVSHVGPVALANPWPSRLCPLLRAVRREIVRARTTGQDWRPVIDALRPFTQDLWRGFSDRERRRFLRHLRTWWDVHRHRVPPAAADQIEAALASGQLRVHAGRIVGLGVSEGQASITFRRRGTGAVATVRAARVIDCTGPATDVTCSTEPLMQALLSAGIARPDPLRLGLDVSARGALINRRGQPSDRLYAIGPLTKGASWEITSVPDIRTQCRDMARMLGRLLAQTGGTEGHTVPFRTLPVRSPDLAAQGNL